MKRSETQESIGLALVNALAKLHNPVKSKTVKTGQYSYAYTPLPEILDAVRPILKEFGLAVIQSVGEGPSVTTLIVHESGEWIESEPCHMVPTASTPQGAGSAISYARRYSLSAMLGIMADDDDDGAAASSGGGGASQQPRQSSGAAQGKPRASGGNRNCITEKQAKYLYVLCGKKFRDAEAARLGIKEKFGISKFEELPYDTGKAIIDKYNEMPDYVAPQFDSQENTNLDDVPF